MTHGGLKNYVLKVLGLESDSGGRRRVGHLLLDHRWQGRMGDLRFDPEAFPDVNGTMGMLRYSTVFEGKS